MQKTLQSFAFIISLLLALSISKSFASTGIAVDSIGNVGVGTQTPQSTLDVTGSTRLNGPTQMKATYSANDYSFRCFGSNVSIGDCGKWDMCTLAYMELGTAAGGCSVRTTNVPVYPEKPTWRLSLKGSVACGATCVRYE